MSQASIASTSNNRIMCYCGLPSRIRVSTAPQNPGKRFRTCPNSLRAGRKCGFWEWVVEDPVTEELLGLSHELNEMKKKMKWHKVALIVLFVLYFVKLY
ncbi:unnamed protein product [Lactuca virosa]|uniref:GRF-type domain-containing protein n=1 Tax=Lactuca virosa TaxID=75947 RepID=A0AAU9NEE8_9ASTR|nr:unnamed protein product [Lactuca virosa]